MSQSKQEVEDLVRSAVRAEREACAMACDWIANQGSDHNGVARRCGKAIRKRGEAE